MLDVAIGQRKDSIILWLLGKAIVLNKSDAFKKMLPKVDKYLEKKYPDQKQFHVANLPVVHDESRGDTVIKYARSLGRTELLEILTIHLKERVKRLREESVTKRHQHEQEISRQKEQSISTISNLTDSLQMLKAKLQQLAYDLSDLVIQ